MTDYNKIQATEEPVTNNDKLILEGYLKFLQKINNNNVTILV